MRVRKARGFSYPKIASPSVKNVSGKAWIFDVRAQNNDSIISSSNFAVSNETRENLHGLYSIRTSNPWIFLARCSPVEQYRNI
ncbi:MAG: hypothetical protein AUF79_08225 [Crenarchaeota archaeon 13_1_20CM_2_51_8]|nr:MAG: hypothetical protein AUF79_08225 [Crenarchaeota archaeon 13_1_20CM_2_51_8]